MNQYTHDFEIETMVTMFMNAMSDIVIKRFRNRKTRDRLKVRVVYAPKQRVLTDLLDRDQNIQLPVMACSIGGLSRDNNRTFNKLLGSFNPVTTNKGKTVVNEKQPLPVDLNLKVSVMTRYQQDMDQILSHLLPYINPYFVISWRTPARPDHEIRSNVYWDGNAAITYPIDTTATTVARVVTDLSFTFKGWIFQAVPDQEIDTIFTIHTNYYHADQGVPIEYKYEDRDIRETTWRNDYLAISGHPPQPTVVKPEFNNMDKTQHFSLYGAGFTVVNNVYLSGAPFSNVSTIQDPFSSVPGLSAFTEPFVALKLDHSKWTSNSNNLVTFVMPTASAPGRVDVLIEGPYGIGSLIHNVKINNHNPFPINHPEHSSYVPYQLPYLTGIKII